MLDPEKENAAAAAAAKSLQSCLTLCDPIDGSPLGSTVPGILQARTQVGCHFLLQCMKVKGESEKVGLKLNIKKTKIMASGPITSWEIDGETVETVSDFILGAPKSLQMVTAAKKLKDAYSLEGKFMINLENILKSRDTTLPTKVCLVKAMVFPVVMCGCESWTMKKAEH